jgi:pimeloyl-ACP methyl ester carboxylesterase
MTAGQIIRDLTAHGVRIRVAEAGEGPPVLLLHDALVSHLAYDRVMAPLASAMRVLAPDLPGFGDSEKPSPTRYAYGVEAFAEAAVDIVAGLELGRVAVVGHSLGAAVAIALAADHPELVGRLVLVDALIYPPDLDLPSRLPFLPIVGGLFLKQLYGRRTFRRFLRDNFYAPTSQLATERLDRYYDLFNTPAARESAHAVLQSVRDTRAIVARLSRVIAPTLVVWGRDDRMLPSPYAHRLVREIAGARLEVLETGHAPHEEAPEVFARIVLSFLMKP